MNKIKRRKRLNTQDFYGVTLPQAEIDWDALPLLLDEKQASTLLGVSIPFLRLSRCEGQRDGRTPGPQFVKLNGSVKYKKSELRRWVEELPEKKAI
jgi:hypothetical protein